VIRGLVVDKNGDPVADATVGCDDLDRDVTKVDSDHEGRFELSIEALGCAAVARHAGLGRSAAATLVEGENTLHFKPTGAIEGMVVDAEGAPRSSFWIAVDSFAPRDDQPASAADWVRFFPATEPVGRLAWQGLPPGRYVFLASIDGEGTAKSAAIEVRAGDTARDVRIVVAKGGTFFAVVVDAETSAPIPGARAGFWQETALGAVPRRGATANEDGQFELTGAPQEPFSIRVVADGYESRVMNVAAAPDAKRSPMEIELRPTTAAHLVTRKSAAQSPSTRRNEGP
jgi:hypothetical protein